MNEIKIEIIFFLVESLHYLATKARKMHEKRNENVKKKTTRKKSTHRPSETSK